MLSAQRDIDKNGLTPERQRRLEEEIECHDRWYSRCNAVSNLPWSGGYDAATALYSSLFDEWKKLSGFKFYWEHYYSR